ncbi:MAG TPA: methyltransferase domain-containing protein [Candidatus Hydrogenedentes bacterium]|nr:methyltransferase domain-containing protein [Candidatus Hydrogenedentota bacterium]
MTQWDPELYDAKHAYVFAYGNEVVEMLAPQPGEYILDLGCGTGHLTQTIADRGARVHGVDSSAEMIAQARAQFPDRLFSIADVRTMRFAEPFDAVFSNAVLHWVLEPEQAVESIAVALKPGGRFVAEFGGSGNVDIIQRAIRNALSACGVQPNAIFPIWYFPGIAEYAQVLEQKGLEPLWAAMIPREVRLDDPKTGLRDWVRMFAGKAVQAVPGKELETFYSRIESECRVQLYRDGAWHADYRRIRVVARKRGE